MKDYIVQNSQESIGTDIDNGPCVFIAMPTFNRGEGCKTVIDLIKKQTYKIWLLLIIDDGSMDDNSEIITSYLKKIKDDRIKYVKNKTNKRVPYSLNRGIKYFLDSDCDYFTWISDDNTYYPNFINDLVSLEADFSYSSFVIDDKVREIVYTVSKEYSDIYDLYNNFAGIGSYMWSKNAIYKIGLYNLNISLCEDFEFVIRTFKEVKNIKFSSDVGMVYILHYGSLYITENEQAFALRAEIDKIYKTLLTKEAKNIIVCFSNLSNDLVIKKIESFTEHADKTYLKIIMTNDEIITLDDRNNLLFVPNKYVDIVCSLIIDNKIHFLYYDDIKFYSDVIKLKNKMNVFITVYNLVSFNSSFKNQINSAEIVLYSQPNLIHFLKKINDNKKFILLE